MNFHNVKDRIETTLDGAINDSVTSLVVDDGSIFPAVPFYITIDDERLQVTARTGDTLTVVRGVLDSTAQAHSDTAKVFLNIVSGHITELQLASALPGDIKFTCRTSADTGWLLCNGAAVSRTTYADLFAVIGTTYGAGDGSTTFAVPNMQGRFPISKTGTSDSPFEDAGMTGGVTEHQLTVGELAKHSHSYMEATPPAPEVLFYTPGMEQKAINTGGAVSPSITGETGSDEEHENLPPFIVLPIAQIKY